MCAWAIRSKCLIYRKSSARFSESLVVPKQYSRSERVADFIKREVAILIQQSMRDPRVGSVNVNAVAVSRDMSHAKIYVTFVGVDDVKQANDAVEVLNRAAGYLRTELAAKNSMRSTPKLRFLYDVSVSTGAYMSKLIETAVAGDARSSDSEEA